MGRHERKPANPADLVVRARLREPIHFPDLSERRALKLSAVVHYAARAHFGLWHRRVGGPDFQDLSGIFTPLYLVEVEVTDVPLDPMTGLLVRGETSLARTLSAAGEVDHLVREGHYRVLAPVRDSAGVPVASARLINVFTRYDPDPSRRRVTTLPPSLGLGESPSRVVALPAMDNLVPNERSPDFSAPAARVWHYGQTDANRHVNGMEYLRVMEGYVADVLQGTGLDLRRLFFSRARILYRKPCFRGEGYRQVAWFRGKSPLVVTGAFYKEGDRQAAPPAVVVELTLSQHEEADQGG